MSTVGSALAALTTLAETTLTTVLPVGWAGDKWLVANGPASSVPNKPDLLALVGDGDVIGEQANVAVDGESYVVPLTFSVSLPGYDQLAADDLAMDAYEAVYAAVRGSLSKPPLGVVGVLQMFPTGEFTFQRAATGDGRFTVVRSGIRVIAHTV